MAKYYVEVTERYTRWYIDPEMTIIHRDGGPAIEFADGDKFWYKDGKCHREDGPAVIRADGGMEWRLNGVVHRDGGPAIEGPSKHKYWIKDGKYHREDGPAIEYTSGNVEYWLNNKFLTKKQWEEAVRPIEELTVAQIEQLLGKKIKIVK